MTHTPFRVEFDIATPIILPFTTTLDGLLSSAIDAVAGLRDDAMIEAMPLARDADSGIFRASSIFLGPRARHLKVTKSRALRTDDDLDARSISPKRKTNGDLAAKPYPKLDTARGDYASRLSTYNAIQVKRAFAFGVGDIEKVALLLDVMMGLGRHAQQGMGQITDVRIEETAEDMSWVNAQGQPQRPLPVDVWKTLGQPAGSVETGVASVLPPYWQQDLHTCVVPSRLVIG